MTMLITSFSKTPKECLPFIEDAHRASQNHGSLQIFISHILGSSIFFDCPQAVSIVLQALSSKINSHNFSSVERDFLWYAWGESSDIPTVSLASRLIAAVSSATEIKEKLSSYKSPQDYKTDKEARVHRLIILIDAVIEQYKVFLMTSDGKTPHKNSSTRANKVQSQVTPNNKQSASKQKREQYNSVSITNGITDSNTTGITNTIQKHYQHNTLYTQNRSSQSNTRRHHKEQVSGGNSNTKPLNDYEIKTHISHLDKTDYHDTSLFTERHEKQTALQVENVSASHSLNNTTDTTTIYNNYQVLVDEVIISMLLSIVVSQTQFSQKACNLLRKIAKLFTLPDLCRDVSMFCSC